MFGSLTAFCFSASKASGGTAMQANWKAKFEAGLNKVRGSNPYYPSTWKVMAAFYALSLPLALSTARFECPQPRATLPATQPPALTATAAPSAPVTPERRIVISIPDRKLAVVEHGRVKRVYRVAVGAHWSPSPTGKFHIANKVVRPTYWHPGNVIAPGVGNPLGIRWMGLDKRHYGIHGTNEPQSIGKAASHGCIRMNAGDVKELFDLAQVGDEVEIHDQRTPEVAAIFGADDGASNEQNVNSGGQ
jgi:L,D-transpeptidase-like protein